VKGSESFGTSEYGSSIILLQTFRECACKYEVLINSNPTFFFIYVAKYKRKFAVPQIVKFRLGKANVNLEVLVVYGDDIQKAERSECTVTCVLRK
jgi:hypothetical protein